MKFLETLRKDGVIESKQIGKTYLFGRDPNTLYKINAILEKDEIVELGTYVCIVDTFLKSVTTGSIEDLYLYSFEQPRMNLMSEREIEPPERLLYDKLTLRLARIKILDRLSKYNDPLVEINSDLPIFRATDQTIQEILHIPKNGIPVGMLAYPSKKGSNIVIKLDPSYLLGPEAAHLNIGGKSGYAKSSLVLVLLKAIQEWSEQIEKKIGILTFNVKKDDFLYLDQYNTELTDEDIVLYKHLDISPEPFEKVKFYATYQNEFDHHLATLRPSSLETNKFTWEWEDIYNHLLYATEESVWDDKMLEALHILLREEEIKRQSNRSFKYSINSVLTEIRGYSELPMTQRTLGIRSDSWARFYRILNGIVIGNSGLLKKGRNPIPYKEVFKHNDILTVDINETLFSPNRQRFILGKIITDIWENVDKGILGLDHLIVVTDELNRYASVEATKALMQIKKTIRDIAERGRSSKVSLFGIQQYPSRIDTSILNNVATSAYSRLKSIELTQKLYQNLSNNDKEIIQRLPKGYMIIDHDPFDTPLLIRYPRPPCLQKPQTTETIILKEQLPEDSDTEYFFENK